MFKLNESDLERLILPNTHFVKKEGQYFFLEEVGNLKKVSYAFDKKKWTPLRRANFSFFKELFNKLNTKPFILDLGVGPGQLQELFPKESKVVGIDFVPYKTTVDFVCDLNRPLPLKSEQFDIVFASNVFEHLYEPKQIIQESARVLKVGGKMFASVPFLLMEHQAPFDFFRYTRFALEKMCKEAGFSSVKILSLGSTLDVFKTTSFHFLKSVRSSLEDGGKKVSLFQKIKLKIISFIFKIITPILSLLLRDQKKPRLDFTMGYGIVAEK